MKVSNPPEAEVNFLKSEVKKNVSIVHRPHQLHVPRSRSDCLGAISREHMPVESERTRSLRSTRRTRGRIPHVSLVKDRSSLGSVHRGIPLALAVLRPRCYIEYSSDTLPCISPFSFSLPLPYLFITPSLFLSLMYLQCARRLTDWN